MSDDYHQASQFYANYHFVNVAPVSKRKPQDIECPRETADDVEYDDFPMLEACSDVGSEDFNKAMMEINRSEDTSWFGALKNAWNRLVGPLNSDELSIPVKCILLVLVFPIAIVYFFIQLRTYLVLVVFNYSGINLRSVPFLNVPTERDWIVEELYFKGRPINLDKVVYTAQRYMTYWIIVLFLVFAGQFANKYNIFDIIDSYDLIRSNETADYILQIAISVIVGLANLVPAKAARPDIGSFISSFMEDDYQIRDSAHTRLKDLSEILNDIKTLHFALLSTEIGTPIIISTKVPEELRLDPGFIALLSTSTFDSNQVLRYIQIDDDVDSFFVLRNDIGMCHRMECDAVQLNNSSLLQQILDRNIHLEIPPELLTLYGGLSLVLLVALFVINEETQVKPVLFSWLVLPLIVAVLFCRVKSKLVSVNFFTLDGKDRKYQAFNSICISNDGVILSKIRTYMYFRALCRFTVQEKFLVHTLLKVTEDLQYDWLNTGLKMRDFKRLAGLAVNTYEKDVGIITPNARLYFHAPRAANQHCVVCIINVKGEVCSQQMTKDHFMRATKNLPDSDDSNGLENMLLK